MASSSATGQTGTGQRSPKTNYLITYNAVSTGLWLSILLRVGFVLYRDEGSTANIYASVNSMVSYTQTLAVLEILHSALGLVRSPILTTTMQVASRLLLVWGVVGMFPAVAKEQRTFPGLSWIGFNRPDGGATVAYTSMLVAWSVTEVIRYRYFVSALWEGNQGIPAWLTWLRYNTFFVLYPLGIGSECWIIYSAIPLAKKWNPAYAYFLYAVLVIYVPGSYILYSHMMAQRKRVLRGKGKAVGTTK